MSSSAIPVSTPSWTAGSSTSPATSAPPVPLGPSFVELFQGQAGLTQAVTDLLGDKVANHSEVDGACRLADVASDGTFSMLVESCQRQRVLWMHAAPPCKTFSMARRPDHLATPRVLRTRDRPEGFGSAETEMASRRAQPAWFGQPLRNGSERSTRRSVQ